VIPALCEADPEILLGTSESTFLPLKVNIFTPKFIINVVRLLLFDQVAENSFSLTYFGRFFYYLATALVGLGFPIVLRHALSLTLSNSQSTDDSKPFTYQRYVFLFTAICDQFMELESFRLAAEKTEERKRKDNGVFSFVFDVVFWFGLVELPSVSSLFFLLSQIMEYLKFEM